MNAARPRRPFALLALLLALFGLLTTGVGAAQTLTLDGRTLRSEAGGVAWSRTFPLALGTLSPPVVLQGRVWQAAGTQLYALDSRGDIVARIDLPAEATAVDESGGDLRVTVLYGVLPENFTVEDAGGDLPRLRERVVFPPLESTTTALERAAREGLDFDPLRPGDPQLALAVLRGRAAQDPTNPFTQIFLAVAARAARSPDLADEAVERALTQNTPFFVSVRLARLLDAMGLPEYADRALVAARLDWAAHGYDPAVPVSRAALRAYGDPLGYLDLLLRTGQDRRAEAWIRYLRDVSPRFEGYRATYARYIGLLEAQDRAGEAYEWRRFQRELAAGSLYSLGPDALLAVRDVARWATWALVVALVALGSALGARAWTQQSQDLAPLGGRYRSWALHPISRARRLLISYWGFGEKLVLVALLAGLLVALSAWTWSGRTLERAQAQVLNFGTYGGAWFYDGLERLSLDVASPEAHFLRGLSAQLDGDDVTARQQYAASGGDACATNNLGVLLDQRGNPVGARELYRAALDRQPDLVAAAYNLGLNPNGFEANFQRDFRQEARLCYPSQRTIYAALDGALSGDVRRMLTNPWAYLTRFPSGLRGPLQWLWVVPLLLAVGVAVLWLFVPRLPTTRGSGRPWRYRVLAVVMPGVAFLDVAWGMVLLLTWSATLVGGLSALGLLRFGYLLDLSAGRTPALLLTLLALCYAVNTPIVLLDEVRLMRRERRSRGVKDVGRAGN